MNVKNIGSIGANSMGIVYGSSDNGVVYEIVVLDVRGDTVVCEFVFENKHSETFEIKTEALCSVDAQLVDDKES